MIDFYGVEIKPSSFAELKDAIENGTPSAKMLVTELCDCSEFAEM